MSSDLMYSKIIDFLEKDGAICNYYDKSYDENETYTNPIGNRGLFKKFNDTITFYHKILKCLIGEIRCNITESIPVIDYNIPSYTSLMSTYRLDDNGNIDPSIIYNIPGDGQDLLELQLNQNLEVNPEISLLNRALNGEEASKLFYNTTSNTKSDNFIYADYMKSDKFYFKYLGTKYDLDCLTKGSESISIFTAKITDTRDMYGKVVNFSSNEPYSKYGLGSNFYYLTINDGKDVIRNCKTGDIITNHNFKIKAEVNTESSNGEMGIQFSGSENKCEFYCIKIPMTYEHIDYCKFMFIQKTKNEDDESKPRYSYDVLTVFTDKDPDTNILWEELKINDFFPDYLNTDEMLEYISAFVDIEKIFYSDYSGILNGQYSYPLLYTDDSNQTVSKWAYMHSNTDIVPDGYGYSPSHVLNRGDFLNSSTSLTPNDYALTEGKSYKGKLSLYYDNISQSLNDIFGKFSYNDYDKWIKNFNSYNYVGNVVNLFDIIDTSSMSKIDIMSRFGIKYISQGETLKYPNKGKIPQQNIDNIKSYIKDLFKSYWGTSKNSDFYLDFSNKKMYVRLGAFDKIIHTSNAICNWEGWWGQWYEKSLDQSTYGSDSKTYTGVDENIYSKKDLHCSLSFTRCYRHDFWNFEIKNCKTYHYSKNNGLKDIKIQLASPLDAFSKKGDSGLNSSILIYPQSDTYFSTEIYLITPNKLLIPGTNTEIKASAEISPDSIVTFCSNDKLISFNCVEKLSYTPSKIESIDIYDDLRKQKEWYSEYDSSGNVVTNFSSSDISIESKDCYLYILKALDIKLENKSKFYDTQNNEINTSDILKDIDLSIMPMSYPKDFFEVTKENDNIFNKGARYKIVKDGYIQINSLKNMRIIVGYPPTDSNTCNKLLKLNSGIFNSYQYAQTKSFGNFIQKRLLPVKNELISNIAKEVFMNWPITDSISNPVKIKDLPEYFDGLKEVRDVLISIKNKNLSFEIDGKNIRINDNDISYLNKIINNSLSENYDIGIQDSVNSSSLKDKLAGSIINVFTKKTNISGTKSTFEQLCDKILLITDKNKNAIFEDYDYIDSCLGNDTGKILNSSSTSEESSDSYQMPNVFSNEIFKVNQRTSRTETKTHRVDWKFYIVDKIANICYDYLKQSDDDYDLYTNISKYFINSSIESEDSENMDIKNPFYNIEFPEIMIDINNDGSLIFGKIEETGFVRDENIYFGTIKVNVPKLVGNNVQPSGDIVNIRIGSYEDGHFKKIFANKDYLPFDKLEYISRYIQRELDGNGQPIRYVEGYDDVTGNKDSLYYKRYKALNSRINTMSGDLYFAALTFKTIDMVSKKEAIDISVIDSYSDDMLVLPISGMSKSKWLPEQEATLTTVKLDGKLYDEDIAESLRSTINNRCVLTCRSCTVKTACPFYNEEEVIKLYVPDLEYIKFSLKDNKLNLVSETDFELKSKNKEIKFSDLDNMHHQWASITNYNIDGEEIIYDFRKIEDEENRLRSKITKYTEENPNGLGWLTRARYGTVTSNRRLKELENEEYDPSQLYDYRYLYNAMFIYDEETYFKYKDSTYKYDVSLDLKENGLDSQVEDTHYEGSVRVKIPYSLDFSSNGKYEYSEDDLLFLVSDDTVDDNGNPIIPVIYINTLRKAMEYSVFDLNEIQNVDDEIVSEDDDGLYPKDVAQWSVNILKGDCADNPLSEIDDNANYDQYWMPELKKRILDSYGKYKYITINGRPRENTNHMGEVFTSVEHVNELAIVSGKPVIGTYQDFTRSFMLSTSIIKWVYPNMKNQFGKDLTYEQTVNKQKSTLPCMKTNLRFVLLKNNEHITL